MGYLTLLEKKVITQTVPDTEVMIMLSTTDQSEGYLHTTKAEVYICAGLILPTSVS